MKVWQCMDKACMARTVLASSHYSHSLLLLTTHHVPRYLRCGLDELLELLLVLPVGRAILRLAGRLGRRWGWGWG
eukprot:scaffold110302_cov45-Phaeocystis_antarctica.AAC.1